MFLSGKVACTNALTYKEGGILKVIKEDNCELKKEEFGMNLSVTTSFCTVYIDQDCDFN